MNLEDAFLKIGMPLIYQNSLLECYKQAHRHYHNIDHINEMLKHVPEDHNEIEIVIEAILFHDIIYHNIPKPNGFNESLSIAEYLFYNIKAMAGFVAGNLEYERRVIEAITATGRHLEDQKRLGEVSKLVLDLDLSTFSLPWDEYSIWLERIEAENAEIYGQVSTRQEIIIGRYQFLTQLLKRKSIYYIKTEWEEQARNNIERDIAGDMND